MIYSTYCLAYKGLFYVANRIAKIIMEILF